jgi:hypothetical protein
MKKAIPFLIILLFASTAYGAVKSSGLIEYFDDVINEKNGWEQIGYTTYIKTEIVITHFIHYSVLRDPQYKSKGVRVMDGAIKKSALDRMTHVDSSVIEVTNNLEGLYDDLKVIGKSMGCNTVIIDLKTHTILPHTNAWSLGLLDF